MQVRVGRSIDLAFLVFLTAWGTACSHQTTMPTARGFDEKAESFEFVQSGAIRHSDAAQIQVAPSSPIMGLDADTRPIVRDGGSRGPASEDFGRLLVADSVPKKTDSTAEAESKSDPKAEKISKKKKEKSGTTSVSVKSDSDGEPRDPASSAFTGLECDTGYDCPAGQFCRARRNGQKICVGGTGANLVYCQSSADCQNGRCQDRGDGVRICMGSGVIGDSCSSNSDCTGGLCRDRGDGVRICMGNGKRNDPCSTSSDCGSGSCKDRGDGLKICM